MSNSNRLLKILGPGLLYAGAAVGVSHLVQSTGAGAKFGFVLVWAVLLANILKYPFFEYGPRYATSTGKSLLEGYKNLGLWAVILFIIMTIGTMFTIQAAVTIVTAGLAEYITGINLGESSGALWSGILLLICLGILGVGRYKVLDRLMKVIIVVLSVTTVVALVAAFTGNFEKSVEFSTSFSWSDETHIFFLIALLGWMPAPIDISVWHSVWSLAKQKDTGIKPTLKASLLDFKIGYWGTTILALCFLSLGALVIYGTNKTLPTGGAAFSKEVINIYTSSLGNWAYWIIAIAAFTTMFSTTLTCLDAFPRVLRRTTQLVIPSAPQEESHRGLYWFWILFTVVGAMTLLLFFLKDMQTMVNIATIISFLTAPVLAILNYMVINGKDVPEAARPGLLLKVLSWIGIVFLCGFSVYFIALKIIEAVQS